jgi:hypothetical protein
MPRQGRHPRVRSASPDDNVKALRLERMRTAIAFPAGFAAEARAECVDDLVHRAKGCRIRPEIDSARRAARRFTSDCASAR